MHRPDRSVLLVGPMCVGKSTLARPLAEVLGLPVRDLDASIVAEAGQSIPELFEARGEAGFRALERAQLRALLDSPPAVIACGGGTLLEEEAWTLVREQGAITLGLEAPLEVLAERAEGTGRPLLAGAATLAERLERLEALQAARAASYARVDLRLETHPWEPEAIVARMAQAVTHHARSSVPFRIADGAHSLVVEPGGLEAAVPWLSRWLPPEGGRARVGLVADQRVLELQGEGLLGALDEAGYRVTVRSVPAGEDCKQWSVLGAVLDDLLAAGLQRGSVVLGLGGGSATDLAGLAAGLLKRGCDLVQLPTSLLGMIDAALGGKTAVNHALGKNLIGVFHQPRGVVACLGSLETLPEEEFGSALGEVAKYALLEGDPGLEWAEALDPRTELREMVLRCARQKALRVQDDPRERGAGGQRIHLNLGHTLGHALEPGGEGHAPLRHGEAVALGLLAALRLAEGLELAPAGRLERVEALLAAWGLPVDLEPRLGPAIWARLDADKKRRGEAVDFVLPTPTGVRVVSLTSVRARGILGP